MRVLRYLLAILVFSFLLAVTIASETEIEYVADGNIADQYSYEFLDATFNGEYFYALYYINMNQKRSWKIGEETIKKQREYEPTICCFKKYDDGEYHCWYFYKLLVNADRIIATGKYVICLDENGNEVELLEIGKMGSLKPIDYGPITNSQYKVVVEGTKIYIVDQKAKEPN